MSDERCPARPGPRAPGSTTAVALELDGCRLVEPLNSLNGQNRVERRRRNVVVLLHGAVIRSDRGLDCKPALDERGVPARRAGVSHRGHRAQHVLPGWKVLDSRDRRVGVCTGRQDWGRKVSACVGLSNDAGVGRNAFQETGRVDPIEGVRVSGSKLISTPLTRKWLVYRENATRGAISLFRCDQRRGCLAGRPHRRDPGTQGVAVGLLYEVTTSRTEG